MSEVESNTLLQLNSLSECIKKIVVLLGKNVENDKLNIEVVGQRIDMYQNILPLLFNINIVINGGYNQYDDLVDLSTFKSDCILLDGPGKQLTDSEYYIEFNDNQYQVVERKKMDITKIYDVFKTNGYFYY